MAISGDYPVPVTVNGFLCRNCTDVDKAKKNIDPADPQGIKAQVKEALNIPDPSKPESYFDAKKVDEAVAARRAEDERANGVDAGRESSYTPPPPGSLLNLSA
ncbi:MAG: hypothetical protein R3E04_09545 [Sphingobium sp.]